MLEAVESADLILVGGGGLLHDLWPPEPERMLTSEHWGLNCYCGIPWLAAGIGKNVMVYAAGVGPLLFPEGRDLVRDLARASRAITLRDEASAEILAGLASQMPRPEVTADPVWRLRPLERDERSRSWNARGSRGTVARRRGAQLDGRRGPGGVGVRARRGHPKLRRPAQPRRSVSSLPAGEDPAPGRCRSVEEARGAARGVEDPRSRAALLARGARRGDRRVRRAPGYAPPFDRFRLHDRHAGGGAGLRPEGGTASNAARSAAPSVKLAGLTAAGVVTGARVAWEERKEMPARQRDLAARMRERAARNAEAALEVLEMAPRAPAPEAVATFEAIRRAEDLKEGGVFVPARVGPLHPGPLPPGEGEARPGRGGGAGSRKVGSSPHVLRPRGE